MKKTSVAFTALALLLISPAASAGIEGAANAGISTPRVVRGNIFFPAIGKKVSADKTCFDRNLGVFKTNIPAKKVVVCSIPELPHTICTENGGFLETVLIPARALTAPRTITVRGCAEWDRTDSLRPVCVKPTYERKDQPIDFTFMKYEVEYREPWENHENPPKREVRAMSFCD